MNIATLFFHTLDILLPPRPTERAMRKLSRESLSMLARPDGALPYHDELVRALVWEIKYRRNVEALALAGSFLADAALSIAEESLSTPVLVPVPMHDARKRARGYNQTELLCEAIMNASPKSFLYAPHALKRMRNTVPQQGLPKYRRLKNVVGSIEAADASPIAGKICIVVDDVSTTGATAHETKRALLKAGASEVHILALART